MGKRKTKESPLNAASRYVENLRCFLYLQHWRFDVHAVDYDQRDDPGLETASDSQVLADIEPMQTRHIATLRLFPGYFDLSPAEKRHVITHELLHVKFAALQFAADAFRPSVDAISAAHLSKAFLTSLELTIDDMAVIVAPHLPLPE